MNLHELREYLEEAKQYAQDSQDEMYIIITKRASEALESGIKILDALNSLGECPNVEDDFYGWDGWWSSYNRLVNQRTRSDGILSVCLEVMGFEYNEVQNVIKQATYTYRKRM